MSDATRRRLPPAVIRGGTLVAPDQREVVVGLDAVTVGRAGSATLTLADPEVSALHCELVGSPKGVVVRDLGSTNGTFIESIGVRECVLTAACSLRVGSTLLRFVPSAPRVLDPPAAGPRAFGSLRGSSSPMLRLYDLLDKIARTELTVLVTGETGTGKELAARAIHETSSRSKGPFVVIDCGALPESLAEATLFGHERGAFTGAVARSEGAFQSAQGGTVFLDELGELPDELQPKLLRVLAERSIKPVGATHYVPVDVRIIAATRRDLRRALNANRFREDLFFRLAQVRVELPPLRDRLEDLPELVAVACERVGAAGESERVADYVRRRFSGYDWPGNARELMNVASVLAVLGDQPADGLLPIEGAAGAEQAELSDEPTSFLEAKRSFEERYFRRLLDDTDGNISEIARRCGLARHQVRAHLKKLGIVR